VLAPAGKPLQEPGTEEISPRDKKKEKREKKKDNQSSLIYAAATGDSSAIKRILDQGEYPPKEIKITTPPSTHQFFTNILLTTFNNNYNTSLLISYPSIFSLSRQQPNSRSSPAVYTHCVLHYFYSHSFTSSLLLPHSIPHYPNFTLLHFILLPTLRTRNSILRFVCLQPFHLMPLEKKKRKEGGGGGGE